MMDSFPAPWGNYLLKEIVETASPEVISWLPQTIGWQIVYAVLLSWLAKKLWRYIQRYKANAYRREALAWLAALDEYDENNPALAYRKLPALLKKTALLHYGRVEVNQLHENQWETWLDLTCDQTNFATKCPKLLTELAHAPRISIDKAKMTILVSEISTWIAHHGESHD